MLGNFDDFIVGCGLFSNLTFSKKSFTNTIRASNGLDPDHDRRSVGPDLGPNCLQMLSADDKSRTVAPNRALKVLIGHEGDV